MVLKGGVWGRRPSWGWDCTWSVQGFPLVHYLYYLWITNWHFFKVIKSKLIYYMIISFFSKITFSKTKYNIYSILLKLIILLRTSRIVDKSRHLDMFTVPRCINTQALTHTYYASLELIINYVYYLIFHYIVLFLLYRVFRVTCPLQ